MARISPNDFDIGLIAAYTQVLVDATASADPETPVSTCGDWTLHDLALHMHEVQYFWLDTITNRPAGPENYEPPDPPSSDKAGDALAQVCTGLTEVLRAADPAEPAWSWADDHTVGFTIRRQIHEAMIHGIDAALATGSALPTVTDALAVDGIDELVDVMITGIPDWAIFLPAIQVVRLHAAEATWTMSLGHISGTSTQTGVTYDGLAAADRVDDSTTADLTISGEPLDLLLWLWGRASIEPLSLAGDTTIADALRAIIADATR